MSARARARLGAALAALAGAACASEGFPPGGPEDKAAPVLVESSPADRAVNAASDQAIRLVFDETLDEGLVSRLRDLVIVNPDAPDFDVELDDDRIVLTPRGPMVDGLTYSVTIMPGIADRDGNRTTTPRRILFAVGGETPITLSIVRAEVVQDTAPAAGAYYRIENGATGFAYTWIADSLGRIEAEGVAYGPYVETAWKETRRPEGWQEDEEPGARDTFTLGAGNRSRDVTIAIAVRDTTPPLVLSAEATAGGVVAIRLDDAVGDDSPVVTQSIRLWEGPDADDVAAAADSIPLDRARGRRLALLAVELSDARTITVAVAEPLRKDRWYRIELAGVANGQGVAARPEGGLTFRPSYEGPAVVPAEPLPWPTGPP